MNNNKIDGGAVLPWHCSCFFASSLDGGPIEKLDVDGWRKGPIIFHRSYNGHIKAVNIEEEDGDGAQFHHCVARLDEDDVMIF